MRMHKVLPICAAAAAALLLSGCGVPYHDVPYTVGGPTVKSIIDRIQCEIKDMVRDDRRGDPTTFHRLFLLDGDYDVEIALSLEVNDTGSLAPSLSYITPLTATTSWMFNANATISKSRSHNFTENIQLSTRKIFREWKTGLDPHECPPADTNLSGELGIKDLVAMAALTPRLDEKQTLSGKGVFGGSIQFIVTKNLSATGPSWALVRFKSIAALGALSEVNTDKITLAFAQGPNVGQPMTLGKVLTKPNPNAHWFLQQLLTGSLSSQINSLQNTLRTGVPQ